jgi:hypothetical protein
MLLTGQIHLYTAEILHHHDEDTRVCKIGHHGGTYLHAAAELSPICPLCQVVRNGSVRPSVQAAVQKPEQECNYQPAISQVRYSANLTLSLLARGPPLS